VSEPLSPLDMTPAADTSAQRRPAASTFSRPQTAQQAVLAALRGSIISGELPPGSPIVQDVLAERFGVSRVPVREALKILEGEGHVAYAAHRGYAVTKLGVDDLLEVYRIRGLLESEVASEAVPRMDDEHLGRMRGAMDDMDAAADAKDFVALGRGNRAFHFSLLAPSGMTLAIRIIRQLWDTTDPYRSLYFVKPLNRETVNFEHAQIFEACRERDTALVLSLLEVHRSHAVDDLKALTDVWT
jgi:DNA-binding GntR family transcriptional regulator